MCSNRAMQWSWILLAATINVGSPGTIASVDVPVAASTLQKMPTRLSDLLAKIGTPVELSKADRQSLSDVVREVQRSGMTAEHVTWKNQILGLTSQNRLLDVDALVIIVVREAFLDSNAELAPLAAKAAYYGEQRARIRSHIDAVNAELASHGGGELALPELRVASKYAPGTKPTTPGPTRSRTVAQWRSYVEQLERTAKRVEEEVQRSQAELVLQLQEYPGVILMMSNISKSLHETAKAVIAKHGT
jgi:hypothetical protein